MRRDPRVTAARGDLADAELEGLVRADRFVDGRRRRTIAPSAAVRTGPGKTCEQVDQLLFGEEFTVLETRDGFAWGQAARDGYVGWVLADHLTGPRLEPTHRVVTLRTFAFAEPSIKSAARGPFSLNALVAVSEVRGTMVLVEDAGWMPAGHLAPVGAAFEDVVAVAERFVGTPYLWGGRDSLGLDCSGLVQQAFYAAGRACPRDSDMQAVMGAPAPAEDLARGDLVFWRGHVGLMLDARRLLHANAHHMAVAIEPLAEATARIAAAGGGQPTAFRRV